MNFRIVLNQLALLMMVISGLLVAVAAWSWSQAAFAGGGIQERHACFALLATGGGGFLAGAVAWGATRARGAFLGRREATLLVALSWFVGAALAGAPFWIWTLLGKGDLNPHPFHDPVNCYFEAMSGLTTTGATILDDIESVPRSLLLWRAITHWLGGLGIVVLFVAVLPSLGVGGRLHRVEAPGPEQEGVKPHIRDTARTLWYLYAGFTTAAILLLRVTGMDWFDSVCHALSAISTGGLSTRDASMGYYEHAPAGGLGIELVIIFFMLIAGTNFALFHQVTRGNFRAMKTDTEFRVNMTLKVVVIAIIAANLLGHTWSLTSGTEVTGTVGRSVRDAAFVTVSMQTGTGYGTANYDLWPTLSKAFIIGFMFIGGSAGSTAGGVKVIRVWIVIRVLLAELERTFRPNVIRPLRIGGAATIDAEMKLAAIAYLVSMLFIFMIGTLLLFIFEPDGGRCDAVTALTASLATLCNVGPGLHAVGSTENYLWFTTGSKIVMSILMALGRLEVYAILVLLTPRFWKSD